MATVFDVAEFILQKTGPISAMKLQKLVYYSQAWHLTWTDAPLFQEPIEAWANGPVAPALYNVHRGQFQLTPGTFNGNPGALSDDESDSIANVLATYGDKTSQWLSDLTHAEDPWREARVGLSDGERGSRVISLASMSEYYSSL